MREIKPVILNLSEIKAALNDLDLISIIESGFISYTSGAAVIPPVGELLFDQPPGDCHIKYGYIKDQPYYLVKVASGFYENPKLGLNSSQGVMLLFRQTTGELVGILMEEGYLTDVRTAIASMITIKYLAPDPIHALGIIGCGVQASMQLKYLKDVTSCKKIFVWGRDKQKAEAFTEQNQDLGFNISVAEHIEEITTNCNVIITTTPSHKPLVLAEQVLPGTHITAIGSDTSEKQELDSRLLAKADLIISDSISQSLTRGEIFKARNAGLLNENNLTELGEIIFSKKRPLRSKDHITIADLTGVAVQDIMIANAVFNNLQK